MEVTRAFLARIEALNPKLNAYLHVDTEGALAQAAQVDEARAQNRPLGKLAGVPVAIKDNLCTRGVPTTCASKILKNYIPPYDAHVIRCLRREGAVLLGKANMDEFAMGSSNENSAFGAVANPWDANCAPGGSSGGSAAATASGLATAALGSDTGGSVRQPGAFCGVAAIKPTYGRVSRFGLIAFASSLDQVGPITRSVRDGARMLSVIAGHDPRDSTSVPEAHAGSTDFEAACDAPVKGLRVGVLRPSSDKGLEPDVLASFETSLKTLQQLGCELVDVSLPSSALVVSVYYLIAPAEASSNLARFDGMRYGLRVEGDDLTQVYQRTRAEGFGDEVERRIMLGTYALSAGYYDAFYVKAQKVRTLIRQDFDAAFAHCDLIVGPTSPTAAFKLGERTDDPLAMYLADIFTLPPSLAGLPAISVPCGLSSAGLPLGLQVTAPAFKEAQMIQLAHAFEQAFDTPMRPGGWD